MPDTKVQVGQIINKVNFSELCSKDLSNENKKNTTHLDGESRFFAVSKWLPQTNFFPVGDNSKAIFSSMGFSYPGSSTKYFSSSWGPFGSFWF